MIAPGDTVHVIGEFNEEGRCDVNHDKGFLIVHPDILVSGTRVILIIFIISYSPTKLSNSLMAFHQTVGVHKLFTLIT